MSGPSGYSEVVNAQLDEIEIGGDPDLYDALLEFVLVHCAQAQSRSSALTTAQGIRFRLAVPGHHPYKVFWSSDGPRIEAVFPSHCVLEITSPQNGRNCSRCPRVRLIIK